MLAKQKLEYADFSAGITENIVPGRMNAYARADNLLITRDKDLDSRPGSRIFGDSLYQLPTGQQRVGSFHPFHNESSLFAQSGRELFYATTSWQPMVGPTGHPAFLSNTAQSLVNSAENRKRTFYVSDSGDGPQMVYPDASGAFQLRQAGLPKPVFAATYTDAQLLSSAITLAVAVKTAMATHAADAAAHATAHSSMATALNALTAPASLSDLITYVGVLKTQYNLHIADAKLNLTTGPQVYHANVQLANSSVASGRFGVLNQAASTALSSATDLSTTISVLNDIRTRYNFHTYSTNTHINAIKSVASGGAYSDLTTGYGSNKVSLPEITQNSSVVAGLTQYSPITSGNEGVLVAYVNQVKKEFNAHLVSTGHNNADTDNTIDVSDATDRFSAYVILAHLEFFYWCHYTDAALGINPYTGAARYPGENSHSAFVSGGYAGFTYFEGTSSGGSATFTSTTINGSAFINTYIVNMQATTSFASGYWAPNSLFAVSKVKVTGGTGTTVVFDHTYSGALAGSYAYVITTSRYHYSLDNSAGSATNPSAYKSRTDSYPYTSMDLDQLGTLAFAFMGRFKAHELASWVAHDVNGVSAYFVTHTGQSSAFYATHTSVDEAGGVGTAWPEASIVIDGVTQTPTQAVDYFSEEPVVGTVLYTAVWNFDYHVDTIEFTDTSTPAQEFNVDWSPSPSRATPLTAALYPVTLSGLPVLVNKANENWDTSAITLDIYRTITNGQTFFKVGSVTNGTTTFTDSITDSNITSGQELYTTGGVVANDQPPPARFITTLNSTGYYGYISDITSGEVFPNRVLQAVPGTMSAVPANFSDDLDDELSGLTNFNSSVIVLCLTSLYRLEGTYNDLGQNGITHQEISKTMGCVSGKSVVVTEDGVFFCGTNGVAWTDGFKTHVVSKELDKTYASYIATSAQKSAISGTYDKLNRRIHWKFKSNATTAEADVIWVLDLNWGISDRMSFTTMSGGAKFTPTALGFYQGKLVRGDALGYVFKYDAEYKSDPLIDTTTAATNWMEQPILWDFESCSTNFGSSQVKKWVTRVTVQGKNRSNLSLQITHKNDNGKAGYSSLVPIRIRNNARWGDYNLKWGDPSCIWKYNGMIDEFRRFNAGTLRCDWKSVRMKNAYVIIANSDDADTAGYATGSGD